METPPAYDDEMRMIINVISFVEKRKKISNYIRLHLKMKDKTFLTSYPSHDIISIIDDDFEMRIWIKTTNGDKYVMFEYYPGKNSIELDLNYLDEQRIRRIIDFYDNLIESKKQQKNQSCILL